MECSLAQEIGDADKGRAFAVEVLDTASYFAGEIMSPPMPIPNNRRYFRFA
jgi:hypothetical protein